MVNANEFIGEYKKWNGSYLTMETMSNWLIETDDNVHPIAFVEFATACQEHLQASWQIYMLIISSPCQQNTNNTNLEIGSSQMCYIYHHQLRE